MVRLEISPATQHNENAPSRHSRARRLSAETVSTAGDVVGLAENSENSFMPIFYIHAISCTPMRDRQDAFWMPVIFFDEFMYPIDFLE